VDLDFAPQHPFAVAGSNRLNFAASGRKPLPCLANTISADLPTGAVKTVARVAVCAKQWLPILKPGETP
jgi:hypothetical protein